MYFWCPSCTCRDSIKFKIVCLRHAALRGRGVFGDVHKLRSKGILALFYGRSFLNDALLCWKRSIKGGKCYAYFLNKI